MDPEELLSKFSEMELQEFGLWSKAVNVPPEAIYQSYFKLFNKSCKDPEYFYRLGFIFFMHNSYQLATIAFQQVLYVDPGFNKANEVHLKLGVIAMKDHDFVTSLKHFTMAKNYPSEWMMSSLIQFNIALLHEVVGKHREAMNLYTAMLENERLSSQRTSNIYCQIGWMLHTVETFGEKDARTEQAIQFLILATSHETNKSGRAHYLLGRCYQSIGRKHDAFLAYSDSVDKNNRNADLHCSIGNLYGTDQHPQALKAYSNAVSCDKYHWAAWTNLYIKQGMMENKKSAQACKSRADEALTFLCTNVTRTVNMNLSPKQRMEYLEDQMSVSLPVQMMQLTRHRLHQKSLQKFKHQMTLELKLTSEYQAPPPLPPPGLFSDQLGCCICTRGPRPGAEI